MVVVFPVKDLFINRSSGTHESELSLFIIVKWRLVGCGNMLELCFRTKSIVFELTSTNPFEKTEE